MAKKKPAPKKIEWYDQRPVALALCLAAWAAMYYFALRALDTANTWQYLAVFVLFIFGLNRLVTTVRKPRD
ncbi:MAG: hypothetical protein JWM37_160 [Candidatus Saccharibacteria bacterium]|nr:hypothetical protein [Candidatus Saccharibacteria bacterium]